MNLATSEDGMIINACIQTFYDLPEVVVGSVEFKNIDFRYKLQILQAKVSVFATKSLKDESFDKYFDQTFNACKIVTAVAGNFILKGFLEKFAESSNHELKCPFKKVCWDKQGNFYSEAHYLQKLQKFLGFTIKRKCVGTMKG